MIEYGSSIYGCDLSSVAIEIARARAYQECVAIDFQIADFRQLPFPDNRFGAVVCVHALPYHFQAEIAQSIGELRRVLQPGGWLYFDLLDCEDAEYGCGPKLEKHTFLDPDGSPIHFSSRQEVDELLYGFDVEHLERLQLGGSPKVRVALSVWAKKAL
ncbi:MAG: class I SAM-dependent methyltransferase [Chloroflexi bacterium]|nr:class I SAM-dependent methyltransferase [Chloroflexota bacterium]